MMYIVRTQGYSLAAYPQKRRLYCVIDANIASVPVFSELLDTWLEIGNHLNGEFTILLDVGIEKVRQKIVQCRKKRSRDFHLIAIDFQKDSIETRLRTEGWAQTEKTLFILEGVIQYITPEAFHELFTLASHAVEGSSVVFTYPMQDFFDGRTDYGGIQRLRTCARLAGITQYNGFLPETLPQALAPYSLDILEDVGRQDYQQRFLQRLNRPLIVWDIERVAHARISH